MLAVCTLTMLLLSVLSVLTQNLSVSTVYADDNGNNNKVKNKSLISDISDKIVSGDTSKAAIQQILQQIQSQIAQTSGQDKATAALNQIQSLIELNPNGALSQSLLSLAKQQAAGNTAAVNQAATQIAKLVASGSDYVGQPLEQAGTTTTSSSSVLSTPSSSSSVSSSQNSNFANNDNGNNNKVNNNKVKNKSLISDISDKIVSGDTSKAAIQQILQQIQTQITQTSSQDKATAALNQIQSLIELNPNGPLSQSLLSLAKQQAAGNTAAVNQAATQIAKLVASGSDYVGQPLEQAGTTSSSSVLSTSSSSSVLLPSISLNSNLNTKLANNPQSAATPTSLPPPPSPSVSSVPPVANA